MNLFKNEGAWTPRLKWFESTKTGLPGAARSPTGTGQLLQRRRGSNEGLS